MILSNCQLFSNPRYLTEFERVLFLCFIDGHSMEETVRTLLQNQDTMEGPKVDPLDLMKAYKVSPISFIIFIDIKLTAKRTQVQGLFLIDVNVYTLRE